MIVFCLDHAVRPAVAILDCIQRSILVYFFDRFYHYYHSFVNNVNSSDSDATISYGSESDFDGFTLGETEQTSGASAAVGQATPSTSGTRPSRRRRVAESDSSDSDPELSSSSSDEVCLYSCISVF